MDPELRRTLGLDETERSERKDFLQLTPEDEERIAQLQTLFERTARETVESFYEHLLRFEKARAFFPTRELLERVKALQAQYFVRLSEGNYDDEYFEDRLHVGEIHHRISLHPKWYLGMYSFYIQHVAQLIREEYADRPAEAWEAFLSLAKLIMLDIGLAIEAYIATRLAASEEIIERQKELVEELSTPVIQIWEGVLALPLVGAIDSRRAMQISENLLEKIVDTRARWVLIDITGVPVVDTLVANHLMKAMEASRLLGTHPLLVGISPQIAQTLVHLGVDLGDITTYSSLQAGLEHVLAEQTKAKRPGLARAI